MPSFISSQIPAPANWQDFENLCCDLWKCIWRDDNTQKNGRRGQKQNGVDVYGRPDGGKEWAGVQCKGKDNYSKKQVSEKEVLAEIEKAKLFKPNISQFIIALTGPRDTKIQELARKITDKHLNIGLFSVSIWSWEDIVIGLADFPNLIEKHYPGLGIDTSEIKKEICKIRETVKEILSSVVVSDLRKDKEMTNHKPSEADLIKFHLPASSSSMIIRKRLLSLINNCLRDYKSIYVCAPSGYGKSILISQLTELNLDSLCWIDCDRDNGHYEAFMKLVKDYVKAKYGRYILDERPRQLAASIGEILKITSTNMLFFVIDHVDNIDAGVEAFLQEILYERKNVKIILAGSKFRFKKQKKMELNNILEVIAYEELAFDSNEVKQMYRDVTINGTYASPEELLEDIINITEGWPIAVGLLKSRIRVESHSLSTIINDLHDLSKTDLYEYLIESYWNTMDESFQQLLMNTSIFNCFDRSDAEAVMPGIDISHFWSELINNFAFVSRHEKFLFMPIMGSDLNIEILPGLNYLRTSI